MQKVFLRYIWFLMLPLFSLASVPILISQSISDVVSSNNDVLRLLDPIIQKNDSFILPAFIQGKANFAIVRSDILEEYYKKKNNSRPYHIIGKVSKKSVLYYLSTQNNTIKSVKDLHHKTVSIGLLGDKANVYLKHILNENNSTYKINMISKDFFHSLSALKDERIDAIFMFGIEDFKIKFRQYIKPYPKGFFSTLKANKTLTCKKNSCYMSYYLIAADSVGKQVMHNIYQQTKSILANKKKLTSNLGQYYIDTKHNASAYILNSKPIRENKVNSPKFGRVPWMDIAIKEAIVGKGSAENVFPMLDLSYKYIRFSKGKRGIATAPNDNKEGSWCAAYICWTLDRAGFKVHKKGRMASQSFRYFNNKLYRKIKAPIFGAITLYTSMRNPLHGHVGYLFGRTKSGKNILLGGNQNNRLKFAAYPARGFGSYKFNGFYVPIKYDIKSQDKLSSKDIYKSAKILNVRYGIRKSRESSKVR